MGSRVKGNPPRKRGPKPERPPGPWEANVGKSLKKPVRGGGWPEGWNYGSFATLHMTWPVWATEHAKSLDLFNDPSAPYKFPFEQAQHIDAYDNGR